MIYIKSCPIFSSSSTCFSETWSSRDSLCIEHVRSFVLLPFDRRHRRCFTLSFCVSVQSSKKSTKLWIWNARTDRSRSGRCLQWTLHHFLQLSLLSLLYIWKKEPFSARFSSTVSLRRKDFWASTVARRQLYWKFLQQCWCAHAREQPGSVLACGAVRTVFMTLG